MKQKSILSNGATREKLEVRFCNQVRGAASRMVKIYNPCAGKAHSVRGGSASIEL